jgi:2'-5' RNA ligase
MGIRSFLAFELPPSIKKHLWEISGELQQSHLPVRWVKKENIHLTIIFLGSVNEDTIHAIGERASAVAQRFSVIKIGLNGVGVFPNWRRPRVLWIGIEGDTETLSHLRDELQRELSPLGFTPEDRPFRPHLTLGRFKGPLQRDDELKWILDRFHDISTTLECLNELILFKSDLKPSGPVYARMAAWPLQGV